MDASLLIPLDRDVTRTRSVLLSTPLINAAAESSLRVSDAQDMRDGFIQQAQSWFLGTQLNQLAGLDAFPVVDVIMGCNHAIDSQLLRGPVQVLEHEYTYYWRLDPARVGQQPGKLTPGLPLIISMPFTGVMDVHPRMSEILDECDVKGIPVHIDAAWITAAKDIEFDFDHPAIHSVFMSLSKGMDLWWNRVGLRWSREVIEDNVTIFNRFHMIPLSLMAVGSTHMHWVPPDHLWNHYASRHAEVCKKLYLRPTKMVHLARSMDRSNTYSLKDVLEHR